MSLVSPRTITSTFWGLDGARSLRFRRGGIGPLCEELARYRRISGVWAQETSKGDDVEVALDKGLFERREWVVCYIRITWRSALELGVALFHSNQSIQVSKHLNQLASKHAAEYSQSLSNPLKNPLQSQLHRPPLHSHPHNHPT